jgi:hypothetical protein
MSRFFGRPGAILRVAGDARRAASTTACRRKPVFAFSPVRH